jgi:hypothetical protein
MIINAILTFHFLTFIAIWFIIIKKTKGLSKWRKVDASIVSQITKGKKRYTYNIYQFSLDGEIKTVTSGLGSNPPSGHIGQVKSILYDGKDATLPNWWLIRNIRIIVTVLLVLYWPFWLLVNHFNLSRFMAL